MKSLFFESPLLLVPVLAVTLLVLAIIWSRRRTVASKRVLLVSLGLSPLLLILQAVVKTDSERITAVCHQLADAVERGDVDAFALHIADDFQADDGGGGPALSREDLLAALTRNLSRYHPEGVRLTSFDVATGNDAGAAEFSATAHIVSEQAASRVLSRWRLRFRKNGDAWQVIDIQSVQTPFWPYRSLREIG
jgi:ketosteroid isomerase-like protein